MRLWQRLSPSARRFACRIAVGVGLAGSLTGAPIVAPVPAAATGSPPNVSVSALNEWDEPMTGGRTVHIVGELHNNGPLAASDVTLAYSLTGGPRSTIFASARILGTGQTTPFEDILQLVGAADAAYPGSTGNPQTSIHLGDAAAFAPSLSTGVRLPAVVDSSCPPGISATMTCGHVTNNTGMTIELARGILSYYGANGTIAAQNVVDAYADDGSRTIADTKTGQFMVDRTGDPCSGQAADPFAPCGAPVVFGEPSYPIEANPASLDFGHQVRGTTGGDVELTVLNTGGLAVPSIAAQSSSPEFTVHNNGCAGGLLAAGSTPTSCRITLQFTPSFGDSDPRTRTGTLTLSEAAAGTPQTIPLSGVGTIPTASLNQTSLTFGTFPNPLPLNKTSAPQSVTMTNTGDGPLTITVLNVTGDFAVQSNACPAMLDAGLSCAIAVVANPTKAGSRSGTLTITDNSGATGVLANQLVNLAAVGAGPLISYDKAGLQFASQAMGSTSGIQTVNITNPGTAAVLVHFVTTGDFAVASPTSCQLNPAYSGGTACAVNVTFTPTQPFVRNGTLSLTDASNDAFDSLPLSGTGVGPQRSLSGTPLAFGSQTIGITTTKTLTVTNNGNGNLTITSIAITPSPSDFSAAFSSTNCPSKTLGQNASCDILVSFTPSTFGGETATLKITYDQTGFDALPLTGSGSGAESLGGTLSAGVAATSWAPGRLDVFSRDVSGALIHNWFDGSWHGWQSLGGYLKGDPGAVSWGPNRIDVVVTGGDDQLWHKWWDGTAWSGWQALGGTLIAGPEVASWSSGRLDIFGVGVGGGLWHKWWDGRAWSGWEPQGGQLTSDAGAVSWGANRIDVFARGIDNAMWHKWWDGAGWSGWEPQGGSLGSSPAVSSAGHGVLDVFALDSGGGLRQKAWTGLAWTGWLTRGGPWLPDPGAVSQNATSVDVFTRAADGTLRHQILTP